MTDPFSTSDHASHDTILVASLADHSLPVAERAAAEALVADVQRVRRPAGRPPRTSCGDQGDAHTHAAERLHADRPRRGPPPFRRLASLRGDPRDVARRPQPAARGRAHDAGAGRSPRLRGTVLHDGQCLVRRRPDEHRCTGRGRGGGERRRVEVAWRGGDPCGLGRGCGSRHPPPRPPATSPGRRSTVGGTARRHRPRSPTVPRSHRAPRRTRTAPRRHRQARPAATLESPTAPATCWPCRRSAASRPSRSCRSRS